MLKIIPAHSIQNYLFILAMLLFNIHSLGAQALEIDDAGNVTMEKSLATKGNATINDAVIGDVGYGIGWAGFAHKNALGTKSFALLQSSDGLNTIINKKGGPGFINFDIDNVTQMVINNDGKVGIGMSDPGEYKLNVDGAIYGTSADLAAGLTAGEVTFTSLHIWNNLSVNGNIGIGTNSPSAKLDVAGNIKIADGTQGDGKLLSSDASGLARWSSNLSTGNGYAGTWGATICSAPIGDGGAVVLFTGKLAANGFEFSMQIHVDSNNDVTALSSAKVSYNQNGGKDTFDLYQNGFQDWYRIKFSRSNGRLYIEYVTGKNNQWVEGAMMVLSNNW